MWLVDLQEDSSGSLMVQVWDQLIFTDLRVM